MIRLIYRHYCDRCHEVIEVEEYQLMSRAPLPSPHDNKYAGMDLCGRCSIIVAENLRKAMVIA